MGLIVRTIAKNLGIRAFSLEDPAQPLLPYSALFESLGLGRSDAGVLMNEHQAMRIATHHTCVKVRSQDLGTCPHEIFQQMPDGSMRQAMEHRYWSLLHDQPNPNMTAAIFWAVMVACVAGWGNGYAWIVRDAGARILRLVPLKPGLTCPVKIRGELLYATTQTDTGAVAYIDPVNVLHFKGVSFDGIVGLGPITCVNAFGLAAAAEKFGCQFFANGARATGVFTYPGQLDPEAEQNIDKSVREMATGEKALGPMILEEGMKWTPITIAPNEAQFMQLRGHQRAEIAGLHRVPLHLIGDLSKATDNNVEELGRNYVRYGLRPDAVMIEQEVNSKILGLNSTYVMEHDLTDLERGNFQSQTQGIQVLRNIGVYSTNDCLRELRKSPISAEEGGEVRTVQGAMIPLSSLVNYEPDPGEEPANPAQQRAIEGPQTGRAQQLIRVVGPMFRDAVTKTIRSGGDEQIAGHLLQPAVSSMAQCMIAVRFGNCDLTQREVKLIGETTAAVVRGSREWRKSDSAAIAGRLAESAFENLAREILA